jgi:multimeric flavodoxin WrbA
MFKVIAVAGSPRREGNSATLLKAALAGATAAGAQAEVVYLNDLSFRGCQGCQPCTADDTCRVQDELTPVLGRLRQADVWLLGAPIYFDGVSGQMKLFFDRLHHLTNEAGQLKKMLPGARAAAILVTYEDKPRDDYREVAQRLANYLGWMGRFEPVEVFSVGRLGPSDAAAARPDLLDQARELGKRLVERLSRPGRTDG